MHIRKHLCSMLLLAVPAIMSAQLSDISGVAFIDANDNGVRDANERGLARVAVSNQDVVPTTDASGDQSLGSITVVALFDFFSVMNVVIHALIFNAYGQSLHSRVARSFVRVTA